VAPFSSDPRAQKKTAGRDLLAAPAVLSIAAISI